MLEQIDTCDKCGKTNSLGFFSEEWLEGMFCTDCFTITLVEKVKNQITILDQAITLLNQLRVICTNDGPDECTGCPGFGFSPNTGAACGAVYQSPYQDLADLHDRVVTENYYREKYRLTLEEIANIPYGTLPGRIRKIAKATLNELK